jgi:hypothetical protein
MDFPMWNRGNFSRDRTMRRRPAFLHYVAAVLPVGKGALRIGLDQADGVPGLHRRQGHADGKRALAAAALLGG